MERDIFASRNISLSYNFNSHAHVERDSAQTFVRDMVTNFNSHAHVERDLNFLTMKCIYRISTHTLTWSVTTNRHILNLHNNISTHTLTWSVTIPRVQERQLYLISTHTLTWSVTISCGTLTRLNFISTHTLTWSVTISGLKRGDNNADFNSHAHVERDHFRTKTW